MWRDIEQAFQSDGAVEGTIVGKVKGGLKVDIGVPAFLPGLARRPPARPQPRSLHRPARPLRDPQVQPLARQRRGVAPRRARARARRSSRKRRSRCSRRASSSRASVKNITDYGAFVDLGGIDGLLHVTDMSWGRVGHPSEVVNVGDRVQGRRAQVRSRARARLARHEADHARSVDDASASAIRSARACTARS